MAVFYENINYFWFAKNIFNEYDAASDMLASSDTTSGSTYFTNA